jgi:hypothetical protein
MTTPITPTAHANAPAAQVLGVHDPILQELWAHKATINAQAHYSIEELVLRMQSRKDQVKLLASDAKRH